VNGASTEWGGDDLAAAAAMACDGVLLPKVEAPDAIAAARAALPGLPVWAMMETPAAILNAAAIAAAPGLAGLVLGTNDLAKDLGCRFRPDRLPLMAALQTCLLAARARGLVCLDGVYNTYLDEAGLRAECEQGRDLGFDGKTLIHPAQIAVANAVFAPSAAETDLARRQIAAWEAAEAEGRGVAVVDGRIVENLHIVTARALLAKAEAIAGRAI
jgi:(3S)-malyl-CoA thioesterase